MAEQKYTTVNIQIYESSKEIAYPQEVLDTFTGEEFGEAQKAACLEWFKAQKAAGVLYEAMHFALDDAVCAAADTPEMPFYQAAEKVLETEWWKL